MCGINHECTYCGKEYEVGDLTWSLGKSGASIFNCCLSCGVEEGFVEDEFTHVQPYEHLSW